MNFSVDIAINAAKEDVWKVITDIDNAAGRISAIQEIEVLERPEEGIIGLKWREVRTMFGKEATEVMWITHAKENEYYKTRAESHGAIYISQLIVSGVGNNTKLTMNFSGETQTVVAKILSVTLGLLFKSATIKALKQDMEDIKAAVEAGNNG